MYKELCERMSYLIPRNVWTGEIVKDYDYSYINGEYDLPNGWHRLFLQMCEDIRGPLIKAGCLDKFRFSQIKEKYGTMRCYNFGAPKEVDDIISKYEYISQFICQKCGKPATWETSGWIASYCDDCIGETQDAPIKFKSTYNIETYSNGEISTRTIDVSDEWNRLMNTIQND